MECHIIDGIVSSVIVLDGLLASDIENFDHFISTAAGNASTIGVELDRANARIVVMESANVRLGRHIPQLARGVLRTRGNQASIR